MKQLLPILLVAASTAIATAQAPSKSSTPTKPAAATRPASSTPGAQLPPGVPPVRGIVKTAFSLRYEDLKVGTGKDAEPNQMYKVLYTGWLAADGHKFDSSYDHRAPMMDKDGKPEMGDDGKPKLGEPQPISIPQGFGRVIPGFDQGFYGMKIGGKRRLFIPWQLAYGARGRPGRSAADPGIPPKADLIFDIELVDVTDLQLPPNHPGMGGMPMHPGAPGTPAASPAPGAPSTPPAQSNPATPGAPAPAGTPAAPATPATPPADKPQSN